MLGSITINKQGCEMKIIEYNNSSDIVVMFLDEFKFHKHTTLNAFKKGFVLNPYARTVCGIGIKGNKYISEGRVKTKEYNTWHGIIERCTNLRNEERQRKYIDCSIDDKWLLYDNFYEWISTQPNYSKWKNGGYSVDKDILLKNNKKYCEEYCCLVPNYVNSLFIKGDKMRINKIKDTPIGVTYRHKNDVYEANCANPILHKTVYLGNYPTAYEAFVAYKQYKESLIKKIALKEYSEKNITQSCFDAMMKYEVEITD